MSRLEQFHYPSAFLDRHWPKDKAGMLYKAQPLAWGTYLARDEANGWRLYQNAENVEICLTEKPDLAGLIWWEAMEKRCYVAGRMPDQDMFDADQFRPMTHDDVTAIWIHLQHACGLHEIDRRTVYFVIRRVAQIYHPFFSQWFYDEDEAA